MPHLIFFLLGQQLVCARIPGPSQVAERLQADKAEHLSRERESRVFSRDSDQGVSVVVLHEALWVPLPTAEARIITAVPNRHHAS
jgi:hypothetical protein